MNLSWLIRELDQELDHTVSWRISMVMRIYFARHGESQANLLHEISNHGLKHGLSQKGRRQALELARGLHCRSIAQIYSSPLLRAIETSVIVAGELQVNYEVTEALREFDCGNLEGRSDEQAWESWQELFDAWKEPQRRMNRIEGGENFYDIQARFVPFIVELVRRHEPQEEQVLCIAHGGLYIQMLPVVLKNVDATILFRSGFNNTDYLTAEVGQAGLVCVEWNGEPVE